MTMSRRDFLEASAAAQAAAATAWGQAAPPFHDGPASPRFSPVPLEGTVSLEDLAKARLSSDLIQAIPRAPRGSCVYWGIPFQVSRPVLLEDRPVSEKTPGLRAEWLVFLHTSDVKPPERDERGFIRPMRGEGRLGEHVADYVIVYADGSEAREVIRRRHQIGMFRAIWGENCFQAVAQHKPHALRPLHEQPSMMVDARGTGWGRAETRAVSADRSPWNNWLWAWKNPHPEKEIAALRFEPKAAGAIVSAVSAGNAGSQPLRWRTRRKAVLKLPEGLAFDPRIDAEGRRRQIQLDMGQVISVEPRRIYPNEEWAGSYNNRVPEISGRELVVEYASHQDARFHFWDGSSLAVAELEKGGGERLTPVRPATQRVTLRVVEKASGRTVPVKLHLHGEAGEYLAPADRHRQPNPGWFEDYAPEFQHQTWHRCTYIDGETVVDLPPGTVYLEVSKGFEIRPVRKVLEIGPGTRTVEVAIEKVLPWRERGWVTADTHVHFLSPPTARLEGCAEGVNVVNLLASQWGELMTNVGDFDGRTTLGAKDAGGNGEWLVRVGTENRQHVLGHISLLGYNGAIIAPMCAGGPDEAALGDPVGALLMEWAERCRQQGGVVVLPHFPNPRCENAADIITGSIDGVEMTSWGSLYAGIDPYSLSDYYRYLNCGYFVAAVGGTDKMSATTAVGTVRTYARIPDGREFTYDAWKAAVRAGNTFVTYGPLMEFSVDGKLPGSRWEMKAGGGTVDVAWDLASVTVPMSKVELVVNGEVRESRAIRPDRDSGHWSVKVERSSWLALMVRGHYHDKPEIIAAHSSPVMIRVAGSEFFAAADAVTILEQIEGALAYVDTVGTRAGDEVYRRIRLKLTAAYRSLHNALHQRGHFHEHTPVTRHGE
ncbi:MAG: CehA/McbA family metallohydrolase [Bryobacterales bacterium]|nr:CehA/McbA family metallohydrolase [Bryobacterales bacterium]